MFLKVIQHLSYKLLIHFLWLDAWADFSFRRNFTDFHDFKPAIKKKLILDFTYVLVNVECFISIIRLTSKYPSFGKIIPSICMHNSIKKRMY